MRQVGLFARLAVPEAEQAARNVAAHLRDRGIRLRVEKTTALRLGLHAEDLLETVATEADVADGCDLAIAVGGDGTLLRTAKHVVGKHIPLLGVHAGRLGFLAMVLPDGIRSALDQTLAGAYTLDRRSILEARTHDGRMHYALNEFLFSKGGTASMIRLSAWFGDQFINTYWADGLILATPTGSTAYNMSSGGPIVMPEADVVVLTPINPHTLTTRPLVLPADREITIRVEPTGNEVLFSKDGEIADIQTNRMEVRVARSAHTIDLIQLPGHAYFDTLRTKLMWGLDLRSPNGSDRSEP